MFTSQHKGSIRSISQSVLLSSGKFRFISILKSKKINIGSSCNGILAVLITWPINSILNIHNRIGSIDLCSFLSLLAEEKRIPLLKTSINPSGCQFDTKRMDKWNIWHCTRQLSSKSYSPLSWRTLRLSGQ